MSQLKQLEQELAIAEKYNFEKREINHLKSLIEKEKSKIKVMEKKPMNLKKILAWIIAIILMATFSYSAYPQGEENLPDETEPILIKPNERKNKIQKLKLEDKKIKKDSKQKNEKKAKFEKEVEIEYELLNEPEKFLYAGLQI